jgi:large subunit ribosomal protein L17
MRHQHAFRKFQKSPSHRRAMFRNMATSLLREERIETTVEKAKELRRVVEPLIALGGEDTLHARRQAYSYLLDKTVVHKLFADIGPRFKSRPGGYTRIVRTRNRAGDAAQLAVMELLAEVAPAKAEVETEA